MKHNIKITLILILMFLLTQIIGLFVIGVYNSNEIPYNMQPPKDVQPPKTCEFQGSYADYIQCIFMAIPGTIIFSFIVAIGIFLILTRLNADSFIRAWFFIVTILAIALALNAFFIKANIVYASIIAILISVILAYFKIYRRNLIIHNLTELIIYPGIAVVLIPIMGIIGIVVLLLLISLYDIWAVWQSQFMQKLAKYQMDNIKIFTGFFIPYADKKQKQKINLIKEKYKEKSDSFIEKQLQKAKVKVNLAILGGGDIVFPIITAGVFYKAYQSVIPSIIIMLFATLGLLYLFVFAKKGKFYPAMPFLTIAMYLGMIISWILMAIKIL
jgi:presenilin-like A22 family membrane protease